MRIVAFGKIFYALAPADDPRPRDLGWKWLSGQRRWMTVKVERVLPLREYADAHAADKLDDWVKSRADAVAASVAVDSDLALPAPAGKTYRPYQLAGTSFMLARHTSLNADVPRLGKTIQTIGVANHYGRLLRILVVCPAVAKSNWCAEARAWLLTKNDIAYAEGNDLPDAEFLVINYDILARHIDALAEREWDIVVFDEAHFIKNPAAARTKAAKRLFKAATLHTIFLTGTPAFTRPVDLWPIVEACDPTKLGRNWMTFVKRYCDAKRNGFGWDTSGHSNEEELQFKMRSTFMIRRTKRDIGKEIPPNRNIIFIPKSGLEGQLKRELNAVQKNLAALLQELALADDADIEKFSEYDGRLEDAGPISTIRRELAMAKIPAVVEHCRTVLEVEPKLVVFAHHRDVTIELARQLDFACIPGGLTTTRRDEQIRLFREEKRGIVGNMQSMGTAISLKEADVAVFAELSWVPSEIDQCEERIWDPTKEHAVGIDRIVIEDSLEAKIAAVLGRRQQSISRLMNAEHLRHSK